MPWASGGPPAGEPAWLAHLARLNRAHVAPVDVVRVAASIVVPLGVGLAFSEWAHDADGLAAGVFASIGALVGAIAPPGGARVERINRTSLGVVLGVAGLVLGHWATGGSWEPVVLVGGLSAVAALVSALGAAVSFAMLQFLVYLAVGSGVATTLGVGEYAGIFVAGGLWATLLTLLATMADKADPDRAVVADVLVAIGDLLRASGRTDARPARWAVVEAYNKAYDQVALSRRHMQGRSSRLMALASVLNSSSVLSEGAVALYRSGTPAEPQDLAAVGALASAVRAGRPPKGEPPTPHTGGSPGARRVRDGVRLVWEATGSPVATGTAGPPRRGWRSVVDDALSQTVASPDSWQFAVRLGVCMAIGEIVRENLPYQHPYWVLLTVAIVLKPDFGSVFTRGVQRVAGTVVGVLLGAALLVLVPHNGWMLLALAAFAAAMPVAVAANYGLFVVALTPVVVILLSIGGSGDSGVVTARLVDTLVGSGIVLVFGYALWPQTWRPALDASLSKAVAALGAFVGVAFDGDADRRRHARRATFRALTQLQADLQRQLTEPPPMSTRAAAWWPAAVQMERASDAVIEAVVAVEAGQPTPTPAQVAALQAAVAGLDGPACAETADPGLDGVLAPVAREVATACRIIRHGPLTASPAAAGGQGESG